jgi:hypothetical protein
MAVRLNGGAAAPWSWVTKEDLSGASVDGMFSFSSNAAQTGKNYPFPTIVTPKDNTYSTRWEPQYVNVHYGSWPLDGLYWEHGRDTMDIFSDMTVRNYPEKTFLLKYTKPPESEDFDFVCEPAGIVEIIGSPVKDAEHNAYQVTIKALSDGSVTITESNSGVSFVLTVTANVQLACDPTSLLLYTDKPQNITFSASAGSIDYTARGVWTLQTADEDVYEQILVTPQSKKNVFSVTAHESGTRDLAGVFTFAYNGKDYSETIFIPTKTPGDLGIYSAGVIKTVERQQSAATGTVNNSISLQAPAGPELYLFGEASDNDLAQFVNKSVTVTTAGPYSAHFGPDSEIISVGDYLLWPVYVRSNGASSGPVSVRITAQDPVSGATYTFTAENVMASRYTVHFDAGGGEGYMPDAGTNGLFTLPDCAFVRTGYSFAKWRVGSELKAAGETVSLSADTVITATWTPHTYTVNFDPNGGSGSMPAQNFTYDVPQALTANAFTPPASTMFAGWNTQADGLGYSYENGASVSQLSAEEGGSVTLYAQWISNGLLTLRSENDIVYSDVAVGSSVDYSIAPISGWTLDGWYSSTGAGGVRILNANGSIAAGAENVNGYTADGVFALTADRTLYARWTRSAYLQIDSFDSADLGGLYVISSGNAAGTQNLVAASDTSIVNATATLRSGSFLNAGNVPVGNVFLSVPDNAVWNGDFHSLNGGQYNIYAFSVVRAGKTKHLRDQIGSLTLREDGAGNNKHRFTYGQKYEHCLQCEQQAFAGDGKDYTVYWKGTAWTSAKNTPPKTCWLFRQDAVYSFVPSEVSQGGGGN